MFITLLLVTLVEQMLKLGRLGIAVWWDVYFEEDGEVVRDVES